MNYPGTALQHNSRANNPVMHESLGTKPVSCKSTIHVGDTIKFYFNRIRNIELVFYSTHLYNFMRINQRQIK